MIINSLIRGTAIAFKPCSIQMGVKMKKTLAIIGNGMASNKLIEELIASTDPLYTIIVFGDEPHTAYNRILLSPVLAGEKELSDIKTHPAGWLEKRGVQQKLGRHYRITKIDRATRRIVCQNGEHYSYDRLVIATGSRPTMLPISGCTLDGVMGFRDISDVELMIETVKKPKSVIIIGAGLLGLEAAAALNKRGAHVTVINRAGHPLNRQLDEEAGALLKHTLEARGIAFKMNTDTQRLEGKNGHVTHAVFSDKTTLQADLVIMTIGIAPNIALAEAAGIQCERGILVSDTMQTFDPSIYALGECVQHKRETFGLVAPLYAQAKVLANHLAEHGVAEFKSLPSATKLKVSGINLFSVGDFEGQNNCEFLEYRDKSANTYKKLVLKNNKLVGALLFGDVKEGPFYQSLIDANSNVADIRHYLIFGEALSRAQQPAYFAA